MDVLQGMYHCPGPELLAAFREDRMHPAGLRAMERHILGCGPCQAVLLALGSAEEPPPELPEGALAPLESLGRPRRIAWRWVAAAAFAVAGLAVWRMPKGTTRAPVTAAKSVDPSWVAPGLRIRGPVTKVSPGRWRLAAGEARIEDRLGGAELETPAGTVKGMGPWSGRVRIVGKVAWIAEALASEAGDLLVEVDEGKVEVRLPTGTLVLSAGERLRGTSREAFPPVPPKGAKSWRPGVLAAGAFPLDLPVREAYSVELRVRLLSPDARLGLAAPVAGILRLWQPSGDECPPGQERRLVFAVLGHAASGSVEGSRLWSLADAVQDLQPASGTPGLRAWGRVEVLEVIVHAP